MSYYSDTVLADGPIIYLPGHRTPDALQLEDVAGGLHATTVGNVLGVSALVPYADDTAVNIGTSNTYYYPPAGSYLPTIRTFELWVRRTYDVASRPWTLFGRRVTSGAIHLGELGQEGAWLQYHHRTNLGTGIVQVDAPGIMDGLPHHLVFTWDGATQRVYIDGVERASGPLTGTAHTNEVQPLRFGDRGNSTTSWGGDQDEVALYSYALSAEQVAAHYAAGISGPPPEPAPLPSDRRLWTHRLAADLDLDPIGDQPLVQVLTGMPGTDIWVHDETISRGLISYSVTSGRPDARSIPDALVASLELVSDRLPAGSLPIGTRVRVQLAPVLAAALGLSAAQAVRFTGEVTDPVVNHARRRTQLTCVGRLGRARRAPVDGTSWPVEAVRDRLFRILTAAGLTATEALSTGGDLVAPPDRVETAGTLLDRTAVSGGGVLLEDRTGLVGYQGYDHRRGASPVLEIAAGEALRDVTWEQHVSDVVNVAEVEYLGGQVVVSDLYSLDLYGPYPGAIATDLIDTSAAYDRGSLTVGRFMDPVWQLPALTVVDRTTTPAAMGALFTLQPGDRVSLAGMPTAAPVPAQVYVEGIQETATPYTWSVALHVSDPRVSGTSIRWIDIPVGLSWDDVRPGLSWLDLARVENPADLT